MSYVYFCLFILCLPLHYATPQELQIYEKILNSFPKTSTDSLSIFRFRPIPAILVHMAYSCSNSFTIALLMKSLIVVPLPATASATRE